MAKIAIKVKRGKLAADKISDDLKVDLRNGLAPEPKQKQPKKSRLFLVIFLLVAVIIFLSGSCLFSYLKKPAFADLVPEEAVVFSLINQGALYDQLSPFYQFLKENGFYGQGAVIKIGDYLNQANLDFRKDIEPLFKRQIAFILMPANSETAFPFALLFERKTSLDKINRLLNQIEPHFKKDYNFSSQIYRQIEITILKPLFSWSVNSLNYAQVGDYFVISNSQEILKKIIDSAINN